MAVLLRLLKEFWLPAVVAAAWTKYSISTQGKVWDVKSVVNIFGPSFFLVSWATGQFFRVKKQVNVDRNLSTIEGRLVALVERLEEHTRDFLAYATGSGGIAYFMPMVRQYPIVELGLINTSAYPVFDIQSTLIDIDEPIDPNAGRFWTEHGFALQSIYQNKIFNSSYRLDMSTRDKIRVNIFIQTRSSGVMQQLRLHKVENRILIAIKTTAGNEVIETNIPADFPGYDPNNPDALFQ